MFLTRWLRECARAPMPLRPGFRPGVEGLEGRDVPAAGLLDPAFAGDGVVTTNFNSSFTPDSQDWAWDVAVYPGASPGADGKVVAVGWSVARFLPNGEWDFDFALARYNPDGSLDTSFGQGGKVTTSMGSTRDVVYAVELVGNKILVAGSAPGAGIALARYNDNGTLDTTFGTGGMVFTKVSKGGAGYAMKVDAAGRIVVAGQDGNGALAVVRYTASGALDKTFGQGGVATTASVGAGRTAGIDLAITPASAGAADAGKIVVVGSNAVARFTTAGVLDASFDGDGILSVPYSSSMPSVAVQTDGRVVVGQGARGVLDPGLDVQLLRLNPNGTFDTSFGTGGRVTLLRPEAQFTTGLAIQPDGKILVAGDEWPLFMGRQAGGNFFVARFTSAGELDPAFGDGGVGLSAENNLQAAGQPNVEIALQDNGKAVVCGWTYTVVTPTGGYVSDFAVARFLGDAALHATTAAPRPTSATITSDDVQPLLAAALARWQAAGVDTSALRGLTIRVADLGGTTLGLAAGGNTIWLDDNAAGWGWFVDSTPWDDSEFSTPGDQGEQNRIDLLSVLEHEIGHLLRDEHEAGGVMQEVLAPGERLAPAGGSSAPDVWLIDVDGPSPCDRIVRRV